VPGLQIVLEYASLISAILEKRQALPRQRALLVGISGIDAAGKGFVAARIAESLDKRDIKPAVIGADGWLNLPHVRFNRQDPARHFYEHAIRFDEMFERVVLPLRDKRSVNAESDFTEETATTFRKHHYCLREIDVIILEGIFLFKRAHRPHFDLAIWVECSFATALRRAVQRGQENLPPCETERAFETIYFAAQRLHIDQDNPRAAADFILMNDEGVPANCDMS
jgi:uridine kinase